MKTRDGEMRGGSPRGDQADLQHTQEPMGDIAKQPFGFYVASRASVPERPAMWRDLRSQGMPINSTWIDEAGEGETSDLSELWARIEREIAASEGVILYARQDDFPLKGALIECGIAIGMGKPVTIWLDGVALERRSLRPLGSWAKHPLCYLVSDLPHAIDVIRRHTAYYLRTPAGTSPPADPATGGRAAIASAEAVGIKPPTSKSDVEREMGKAMGARANPLHPMFRDHNCAWCLSGQKPCKRGNPSQCEYPHARND